MQEITLGQKKQETGIEKVKEDMGSAGKNLLQFGLSLVAPKEFAKPKAAVTTSTHQVTKKTIARISEAQNLDRAVRKYDPNHALKLAGLG